MKNKLAPEEKLHKNRESSRIYYEKNKETISENNRIYYEKNKETVLAAQRVYREKNKEAISAKRHPTEIVAQLIYVLRVAKTRANRHGIKFNISIDEALHIYYSQNGKCAYSKMTFTMGTARCPFKISPDQIIPGGGYTKENVQFVTAIINKMKLNLPSELFIKMCNSVSKNSN